MSVLGPDESLDRIRGRGHRFVLPDAQDSPACTYETRDLLSIALPVARDLGLPVVAVLGRRLAVEQATVPEAAVHEDGELWTREYDVGTYQPP